MNHWLQSIDIRNSPNSNKTHTNLDVVGHEPTNETLFFNSNFHLIPLHLTYDIQSRVFLSRYVFIIRGSTNILFVDLDAIRSKEPHFEQ